MVNLRQTGLFTLVAAAGFVATAALAQTTADPTIDVNSDSATATEEATDAGNTPPGAASIDHEIIIVDGAYFPPLIYATVGDRIVFNNASSGVHIVEGPEESWSSGPIPIDGFFRLKLGSDTPLTFRASVDTEGVGAEDGDVVLEQIGEITYDPAPFTED